MQVISSSDFKPRVIDTPEGQFKIVDIFGRNGQLSDGPQCFLTETRSKEMTVRPHFHKVEQFQVFVGGSGFFGKKPIAQPVMVHYADRFTPYGPIAPTEPGLQYMTFRLKADPGPRRMPEARAEKTEPTGRSFMCGVGVEDIAAPVPAESDLIAPQPDGLAVRLLKCAADQRIDGMNPADCVGAYYIVIAGSVMHDGRAHPRLSTFFFQPDDLPPRFLAGSEGAALLLVVFPECAATDSRFSSPVSANAERRRMMARS